MFCKSWNLRTELEEYWAQLQEDMGLRGFGLFLEQRSKKFKCDNKRRGAVARGESILV